MAEVRARVFEFAVSLDDAWTGTSDQGGLPLENDGKHWTPEHLVLAGLARCSLTSLRHHAKRAGLSVTSRANARGTVTRREEDGRFAFVELAVEAEIALDPAPTDDALRSLLARAEHDCFVGASLTASPRYSWIVNGRELS